jgi:hypothetical protein
MITRVHLNSMYAHVYESLPEYRQKLRDAKLNFLVKKVRCHIHFSDQFLFSLLILDIKLRFFLFFDTNKVTV